MRLEVVRWEGASAPSVADLRRRLEDEGFSVWPWAERPDARYGAHHHDRDETIWVVEGEMTFGAGGGEHCLGPGDRLMLPRGTLHTAVAGPRGASYLVGER